MNEKIKEIMQARGFSQADLSRELDVSEAYVSNLVHGRIKLGEKMKKRMQNKLGVDVSYWVDEVPPVKIELEENKQENNVISDDDLTNYSDIIAIAIEIQKNREELLKLIKIEREKISNFSGADTDFLHEIEMIDDFSEEELLKKIVEEKKNRKVRRVAKNRAFLIQGLMNNVIHNPYGFILNGIEQTKTFVYNKRAKEEN